MKKIFLLFAACAMIGTLYAQHVTVQEPEFINSYYVLTSDSTYDILPKESGNVEKHQSKFSKFSKIAGAVSDLGFAGGMIGASTGNVNGLVTGVRVMGTAASVGVAADAVNTLAGVEGMDIVFPGFSSYTVKDTRNGIKLLIKAENNESDPMDIYRIVKFKSSKKDRRIQWMEIKPALLGSSDAKKKGYLSFIGHKFGLQSYLLDIPASEVEPGEYGIFFMSIITSTEIPVGTFSITK